MKSIKKYSIVACVVVAVLAVLVTINPELNQWVESLAEEPETFTPDDWSSQGPVPLPSMGEVQMVTNADTAFVQKSPEPTVFDTDSALNRDTWKVIVINQFKGRTTDTYKLDSRLLDYLEQTKAALSGSGQPTEVWFLRLNRPFMDDVWTLPDMYRKCGTDGSACFDHYLIFAQSTLDYSLEREYLSILNNECEMTAASPALAVLVVDEKGDLRHAYSPCTFAVDAKRLIKNFDHHTDAEITVSDNQLSNISMLPAYSLETNAKDNIKMQGRKMIRQVTKGAEVLTDKAKQSFDEAVESWK